MAMAIAMASGANAYQKRNFTEISGALLAAYIGEQLLKVRIVFTETGPVY